MKKLWLPLTAIAIWVVFFVLGPWYAGNQLESNFDKIVQRMNTNGVVKFEKTSYEKGIFSSTTNLKVSLDFNALGPAAQKLNLHNEDLSLNLIGEIKHGPFLFHDGISFAIGNIAFQPVLTKKQQQEVTKLFGKTNPFALNMRLKWNKDIELGGSVIPFKSPDGTVDSKTMTLGVSVTDNDKRMLTHFNWGGLTANIKEKGVDKGSVEVGNVVLTSDQKQVIKDLWMGNGAFDIDEIKFSSKNKSTTGIFKKFHVLSISNIDDKKEFIKGRVSIKLDKATVNKVDYVENLNYIVSFKHVDAISLQKLTTAIRDAQKAGGSQQAMQMAMGMQLMGILPELVKKGFSINIDALDAKILGGELKSKLEINIAKGTDVTKGMAAIAGISAKLNISVERSLLSKFPMANPQMVQGLISQGLIVEKAGVLSSKAEFKGGQLTVNGKPIPLPIPGLPSSK